MRSRPLLLLTSLAYSISCTFPNLFFPILSCLSFTAFPFFLLSRFVRTSSTMLQSLSPLASLNVREYTRLHAPYLDVRHIQLMRFDGDCSWIYDNRYCVNGLSVVGVCTERGMQCGGRGPVLQCNKVTYVEIPFNNWKKSEVHARWLAPIFAGNLRLVDDAPAIHSPNYVAFTRALIKLYFLANFDYWFKKIVFAQRFCDRTGSNLFCNGHFVDIFGIPTSEREEIFVKVQSWWSS